MVEKSHKPLVIAHRGETKRHTENTLEAFQDAFEKGADGIELDVLLTSDHKIVVCHDLNLKRLTGKNIDICQTQSQEIQKIRLKNGERIPFLNEVLDEFLGKFKKLNIEIKYPKNTKAYPIAFWLHQTLESYQMTGKIHISSFHSEILKEMHGFHKNYSLGLLLDAKERFSIKKVKAQNHWLGSALHPHISWLKKPFVKLLNPSYPLWVWTANSPTDWELCLQNRCEAIITDHVTDLISYLKN